MAKFHAPAAEDGRSWFVLCEVCFAGWHLSREDAALIGVTRLDGWPER